MEDVDNRLHLDLFIADADEFCKQGLTLRLKANERVVNVEIREPIVYVYVEKKLPPRG